MTTSGPLTAISMARHIADGALEELLPALAPSTPGVFLYHPGRLQVLPKLRAFIDHVRDHPAGLARPRGGARQAKSAKDAAG